MATACLLLRRDPQRPLHKVLWAGSTLIPRYPTTAPSPAPPYLHQGVLASTREGEASAVEGDVVQIPQHCALRRTPVLGAEPAAPPARAVRTGTAQGVLSPSTGVSPAAGLSPFPPALTTGCSAGGCSVLGHICGHGAGRGRRSVGCRPPCPGGAPGCTHSRWRSRPGSAPPRQCLQPCSWRDRRTRSPSSAARGRTAALWGARAQLCCATARHTECHRSWPAASHHDALHPSHHIPTWSISSHHLRTTVSQVHPITSHCVQLRLSQIFLTISHHGPLHSSYHIPLCSIASHHIHPTTSQIQPATSHHVHPTTPHHLHLTMSQIQSTTSHWAHPKHLPHSTPLYPTTSNQWHSAPSYPKSVPSHPTTSISP